MVVMTAMWCILWARVGMLQGPGHEKYYDTALKQRIKDVTVTANRGCIYDRNGVAVAVNLSSASYGVRPEEIVDVDATANALSSATGMTVASIKPILTSQKKFLWLVRQADAAVIRKIDSADITGLHKHRISRRYYPLGKTGAQVIGYTDVDGRGIEGCELYYDNYLSGHNGRSIAFRDAKGRSLLSLDEPEIEARNGFDVQLTIDRRIQEIADEELEACVSAVNAVWGGAIILDTGSGEILAISNAPKFDPNDNSSYDPNICDPAIRRNRIVTDMQEPGSTFKIVPFIEAIESGVLSEEDLIDCENGKYKIGRHTINDTHKLGIVPARDVLIHSSNVGIVKVAEMLGKQKLYERARLLGFGTVTGIDFPNESKGQLPNPRTWSNLSLPTMSFGHGVAVSPVQMAMAYAAVANGGLLLRPYIIKRINGRGDRPDEVTETQVIRRALSAETASRIEELLCEVVEFGTGKTAALPNIRLAGKTGTAQRIKEDGRGYETGQYISSFVGYVTDRDPKILCLVMIDSPEGAYYGSQVAAPIFKRILNRMLNMGENPWSHITIARETDEDDKSGIVPGLKGMSVSEAVTVLGELGFAPSVVGDSTTVVKQLPPAGAVLNKGTEVVVYSNSVSVEKDTCVRVPKLKGKTVREAIQDLVQIQLRVNVTGSGVVEHQTPPAGSLVEHGTVCMIVCQKK